MLNANILGFSLAATATTWGDYERCGQDLLIVVDRAAAFPFHLNGFGDRVDDNEDLSWVRGIFKNTLANYREIQGMYPEDEVLIYHGTLREHELCFYLS